MIRRSRLLTLLVAVALAACDATGPRDGRLPELREGFTYLKRASRFIRNTSMEGFTVQATALARWNDRVGAVVMVGYFYRTFSTSPVYDWSDGSSSSTPGGGDSEVRTYSLHLSEDGGATWRELPVEPYPGEPTGPMTGLILTDDRIFAMVHGGSGRQVVEIDPETGFYEEIEVRYADGGGWQPVFSHARVFGPAVVSSEIPLDNRRISAWRGNLATGEAHRFAIQNPECAPWRDFLSTTHGQGHVATSPETIEGLCVMRDDRVCSFRWSLREDAPETTPMEIRGCISREIFDHPPGLAIGGVVPEFEPVDLLFGPGGMWVVGEATSGTRRDGTYRVHGAALALRPDGGAPDVVDLGPSGLVQTDRLSVHPHRGGLALVRGGCGDGTEDSGRCHEDGTPPGDHAAPRLAGWDEDADAFGIVRLSPSACVDPGACPALPARLLSVGDGRYLSAWTVSSGLDGDVERGLAIGFVHAPWYEPPAPPPEPGVATPLEMRCWAEIECDPGSRSQDPSLIVERVRSCIDRWRQVRGAPDTLWEAFVGTALDDCDGLRAADPPGFVSRDTCPYAECDPSGQVVCGSQLSCEHANGGTCTVIGGVAGCFADACPEGGATPARQCDAAGRWVDCVSGIVDDCAARGLTCSPGWGCLVPDPRCEAGAQRCDGSAYIDCLADGAGRRIDCARSGQTCESGDWGATCAVPYLPPDLPRCEGSRLFLDGRIIDCAAVGMRCLAQPDLGLGYCEPSS